MSPATGGLLSALAPAGTSTSGAPTATATQRRATAWRMFREAVEIIHEDVDRGLCRPSRQILLASTGRSTSRRACASRIRPFWIGGGGEQVTLKLVAQYGDACNIGGEPDTLRRKFAVLRGHCEALGRDYDSITRSTNLLIYPLKPGEDPKATTEKARAAIGATYDDYSNAVQVGTPEQIAEQIQARVDAGANYVIANVQDVAYDHDRLHLCRGDYPTHPLRNLSRSPSLHRGGWLYSGLRHIHQETFLSR